MNNNIANTGTVNLDGLFDLDLSGANLTTGNSWTLVSGSAATYGSTFSVQTSSDLTSWTQALTNIAYNGTSVVYTLPLNADNVFVRLVVTPN